MSIEKISLSFSFEISNEVGKTCICLYMVIFACVENVSKKILVWG